MNKSAGDLSPEITSPLLLHGTVTLGEDSVIYRSPIVATLPTQLQIKKPCDGGVEDCNQTTYVQNSTSSCSIPVLLSNGSQSPSLVKNLNS